LHLDTKLLEDQQELLVEIRSQRRGSRMRRNWASRVSAGMICVISSNNLSMKRMISASMAELRIMNSTKSRSKMVKSKSKISWPLRSNSDSKLP